MNIFSYFILNSLLADDCNNFKNNFNFYATLWLSEANVYYLFYRVSQKKVPTFENS